MPKTKVGRIITVLLVALAILLSVAYLGRKAVQETFRDDYELFRSVRIGMTEAEVVKLLGQPDKVYLAGESPTDYYVQGYARKERAITNKVLIYIGKEPIVYIYFDRQDRVEDIFVGGS